MQNNNTTRKRTSSYVMTIDPNSVSDWEKVNTIRNTIRAINYTALQSNSSKRLRVSLKGRLGRNNPAYTEKYKSRYAYHVDLADAARIDVYIHDRSYR